VYVAGRKSTDAREDVAHVTRVAEGEAHERFLRDLLRFG
jgi:hypothetical protein